MSDDADSVDEQEGEDWLGREKPNYKIWGWTALLLLALVGIWGTLTLTNGATPYYIAVSGPMTGTYASDGKAMEQAIQLHLDEINQQGGIDGHPVELLVYDDENKPELAAQNAEKIAKHTDALAVIGHYTSSASLAAAPIYKAAGLPAITGTATTDSLTQDNDWYFRVTFNNSDQATLMANYIYKVMNKSNATLISTDTVFGSSLADNFVRTAKSIGLDIKHHWTFQQKDSESFDDALDHLLKYYGDSEDDSVLFIATHSAQAASTIVGLRRLGKSISAVGADSLASTSFRNRLAEFPQERARPGYYTNGVLATMPFLPDIAGQQAQNFYHSFLEAYHEAPSSAASMYYDATQTVVKALQGVSSGSPSEQRKQVQSALWQMADIKSSVDGISGSIYFDRHGDAIKSIPIGIFKNGKPVAAQEQFQPIADLSSVPNLLQEALDNQIIYVNGKFMRRAQVVYVGLDFNQITELSAMTSRYSADFYLWFRFQQDYKDKVLEFINSAEPLKLRMEQVLAHTSSIEEGVMTRTYRVKTPFKVDFDFSDYPLDKQNLQIKFRHKNLTRDHLIFVVDTLGMNLDEGDSNALLSKFERNKVFYVGGWQLNRISFFQSSSKTDSTLGIPELFGAEQRIEYSQFNAELEISRNVLSFILKNLLPVIFVVMLGYFVFYIPIAGPGFAVRMTLSINMILSTSLFHIRMASTMPEIDYLMLIEYIFYMVYLLAVFNMLVSVFKQLKMAGDDNDKLWGERVNQFGMVFYPLFITITLLTLYFLND